MTVSDSVKPGLLERLGLHRPELRAWAMYDWANSAMVTVIITAVFPIFFRKVANAGAEKEVIDVRFLGVTWVSIVVAAALSPILGAVADYLGIRKRLLASFMLAGVVAVAGMAWIQQGVWVPAAVLFFAANLAATCSFVFYDALLPHIANEEEVDRVSTAGFALGYVGGGIVLSISLAMILFGDRIGLGGRDGTLPSRLAFLLTAVWWLIFSIPLLRRVPEPPRVLESGERAKANPLVIAFGRLGDTLRELRTYRHAFLLLVAFLIYSDGIGTIIRMAADYGGSIGISEQTIIASILITQFIGIPCAFLFGMLAGHLGAKRCVYLGLAVYVGITLLAYFMQTDLHFLLLAVLVGTVQGGTQALSRSLFATMTPRHKSGEFFGFFGVMDRFAGSIGTGVMWLLVLWTGDRRLSILAIAAFFIIGAALLSRVDVEEGRRRARAAEAPGPR